MTTGRALLVAALLILVATGHTRADPSPAAYLPFISNPAPIYPDGCATCAADVYNCSDFPTQTAAQTCFLFCLDMTGIDIHRLDGDNDGLACELLP